MRKYILTIIFFVIIILPCIFFPPDVNIILTENFIVIIFLFTLAHLLKLNVDKNVTTVGDIGAYLLAIFTLRLNEALFSIFLFSLIGFIAALKTDFQNKRTLSIMQSVTNLMFLYVIFVLSFIFNRIMGNMNIVFRYITIFIFSELLLSIPYAIRYFSTKTQTTRKNMKKDIKYYILNDIFFATFFFPFIYFYKIKSYEFYNVYLVNVVIFYFIIYFLVKNLWIHLDYLFSFIRLHEFANYLSGKEGKIDVFPDIRKFLDHFLDKKIININMIPEQFLKTEDENVWNVGVKEQYLSRIFIKEKYGGELEIITKKPIIEREQIIIDLLIKQVSTISNYKIINEKIQHDFFAVLEALIDLIEAKDPYSAGHSKRVSYYAQKIAEVVSPENKQRVRLSALLHDIGKLKIPTEILTKRGKLTESEYDLIKQHPVYGFEMLINLKGLDDIIDGVLYHHERLDGSGYPYGVTGASIPGIARIIHVADMYDAMTSDRPYRKKMTDDECFSILLNEAQNNKIDAKIVNILIEIIKKRKNGEN